MDNPPRNMITGTMISIQNLILNLAEVIRDKTASSTPRRLIFLLESACSISSTWDPGTATLPMTTLKSRSRCRAGTIVQTPLSSLVFVMFRALRTSSRTRNRRYMMERGREYGLALGLKGKRKKAHVVNIGPGIAALWRSRSTGVHCQV